MIHEQPCPQVGRQTGRADEPPATPGPESLGQAIQQVPQAGEIVDTAQKRQMSDAVLSPWIE
jgi:hypothetical protein